GRVGTSLPFSRGAQRHLDPRIDALGMRGEEIVKPARDLVIVAAREHDASLAIGTGNRVSGRVRAWGSRATPRVGRLSPDGRGRSAFVESAGQALLAALFIDEGGLTTFLAEIADLLAGVDLAASLGACRRIVAHLHLTDVLGQGTGQRIRKRQDLGRP